MPGGAEWSWVLWNGVGWCEIVQHGTVRCMIEQKVRVGVGGTEKCEIVLDGTAHVRDGI